MQFRKFCIFRGEIGLEIFLYGLLAVNCLLIFALLIRGRVQESIFSAQLGQEISRLEPEVKKVRKVEEQMGQLLRRAETVSEYKGRNTEVLGALAELSSILPKDTFVTDLNFKAGVIEINGLSGTAAALPQIIDNSPRFKEVEFVSAITRSTLSADKEGYRLRMKLEVESRPSTSLPGQPTPAKPVAGPAQGPKAEPARERKP